MNQIFRSLTIYMKGIKVMFRLFKTTSGPFNYRLKTMIKFYPFYIRHSRNQQQLFEQNINHSKQQNKQTDYKQRIKVAYKSYSQKIKNKIKSQAQQIQDKTRSQYQKQVRSLLHKGMEYLSLYYESLQNLIEGRRQVLREENFKFEDGFTVEQKRIKFQKYLARLLGRKQEEIERLDEEYELKKEKSQYKKDQLF